MKVYLSISLIAIAALFLSCKDSGKDKNPKEKPPAIVDVLIAGPEKIAFSLDVNGTVLSDEMIEIHTEVSGRITMLNMPDGAYVAEGTVLAKLNNDEIVAELEQLNSQLELARKTEKRLRDLLKVNGVNQAEYDAALNQVQVIEANVKITTAKLDKTILKAPFSGKLGLRQVSNGAYVTPQTVLGSLQTDKVKIDFTVPETQASLVKIGNLVKVQNNGSSQSHEARIVALEPQINTASRNVKVRALLNSGSLYPGSFVKVSIEQVHTGISVPTNAIIPDAQSSQVVLVKEGKAVFTNVETGYRTASKVELLNGIAEGDSVIVSGMLFVRPNAVVKVRRSMKPEEVKP